jgi:cytochrome c biogenesis protein CcmG, thiol:disulfide interchange protein DsbE
VRALRALAQLGALALVFSLLGLLVWKVARNDSADARIGQPAPNFTLPQLENDQRSLSLASYRGKTVVINFWASWCGPCHEEAPLLQSASVEHRDDGVVFIGIDTRDLLDDARKFVAAYGIAYPNVYDGGGSLWEQWGLTGLPETFVLDSRGRIVAHVRGPIESAEQLDEMIERARA